MTDAEKEFFQEIQAVCVKHKAGIHKAEIDISRPDGGCSHFVDVDFHNGTATLETRQDFRFSAPNRENVIRCDCCGDLFALLSVRYTGLQFLCGKCDG